MMKSSSTISREYELVNAKSSCEHPAAVVAEDEELYDGVWSVDHVPTTRRLCGRRRRTVGLIACALVVVVILVLFSGGNGGDDDPAAANESSNQSAAVTAAPKPPPTPAAETTAIHPAPTATPTAHESASIQYHCRGDRIQNDVKLPTDQYICDHYKRYRFGLDHTGSLLYADDAFNKTAVIYDGHAGDYFKLLRDGRFTVYNTSDDTVWQQECDDEVSFWPECLPTHHDVYDCPYLHLHSGGTIVLNWITKDGDWKERNILHMYKLPHCHDHFFCNDDP